MSSSTIAIIILVVVVVLFATEKLPLAVTSVGAMLAMYFAGILNFEQTFSGFSNNVTIMLMAMGIIGGAFYTTGLSGKLSHFVIKIAGGSEKRFIIIAGIICMLMSMVFSGLIVGTVFLAIVDCLYKESNGTITRKHTYLPLMMATVYGGIITNISSTSTITASGLLAQSSFGRGFTFFEPFKASYPALLVWLVVFCTFGYAWTKKCCDFEDIPPASDVDFGGEVEGQTRKLIILGIVLAVCVYFFIFSDYHLGAVALTGAIVLILFGCIDIKTAIKSVNWETMVVVAGTLGFAKGIDVSGAGEIIANKIIDLSGPLGSSAFAMAAIMMFLGTFMSNYMSNNSAVAIICPIAFAIANTLGVSPLPFALATAIGSNLSVMTPICTAIITMTTSAGYRFKDYVRVGGVINVLGYCACVVSLYFVYFA